MNPRPTSPIVSVCIPTYRGMPHLPAAIESVLAQTFSDFELLIIDDNSPDDSFAAASSYKDSRIRCLRNAQNLGPEGNWNRCLTEATGRYFKLLPQDDVLASDCLRREVDVLQQDVRQQIALVFCARAIIDGRGRQVMVRRPFGQTPRRLSASALFRACLRRGTNVIGEPGAVLFRRDLASTVGLFDASFPYVVDLDYWLRLLAHGDGFYIPESLACFRVSPGAWSVAIGTSQAEQFAGLMKRVAKTGGLHAGTLDLATGQALALVNNAVRLLLYRFLFRGSSA